MPKNKPQLKNKIPKVKFIPSWVIWVVGIIMVLIVIVPTLVSLAFSILWQNAIIANKNTRAASLSIPARSETVAFLQEQSKMLNFDGSLVYENIKDNQCKHYGFSLVTPPDECTYTLKKYYTSNKNIQADLEKANTAMSSIYIKADAGDDYKPGAQSGSINYRLRSGKLLRMFKLDFIANNSSEKKTVKQDLDLDKAVDLLPGEYIYGVSMMKDYRYVSGDPIAQ